MSSLSLQSTDGSKSPLIKTTEHSTIINFIVFSFTDADLSDTFIASNDPSSSVQALEGRVPNYLLLVSLLEHLCSLYENDPEKSKKIFNGKT